VLSSDERARESVAVGEAGVLDEATPSRRVGVTHTRADPGLRSGMAGGEPRCGPLCIGHRSGPGLGEGPWWLWARRRRCGPSQYSTVGVPESGMRTTKRWPCAGRAAGGSLLTVRVGRHHDFRSWSRVTGSSGRTARGVSGDSACCFLPVEISAASSCRSVGTVEG
jgi:hypothetical protein